MTVLDAYAVIAALLGEPARSEVEPLLREATPGPKLSAVNVAEVLDKTVRWRGVLYDEVLERLYWLGAGGLEVVDADLVIAGTAGFLRGRHYDRKDRDVSLADCFMLATASVLEEPLATSDQGVCAIARYEEIEVVPLPDSTGHRPT